MERLDQHGATYGSKATTQTSIPKVWPVLVHDAPANQSGNFKAYDSANSALAPKACKYLK